MALCNLGLPHARGGVSGGGGAGRSRRLSSPRPWGCFWARRCRCGHRCVFPTPVGVFPIQLLGQVGINSLPHARGGVSKGALMVSSKGLSSPRPWGCFQVARRGTEDCPVFPTPVGVFPTSWPEPKSRLGLPHARGGVSCPESTPARAARSSPRPWGCFHVVAVAVDAMGVFPTPVGVFPSSLSGAGAGWGLPHARGGVSSSTKAIAAHLGSSPRPWGCFLAGSAA